MRRALVVALVVAAACGGSQKPPGCDDACKRNQIALLWTQIREWRREAHMNLEPAPGVEMQVRPLTIPQVKRVCQEAHEVPPKCTDICEIAGDICDNAESICKLADELGKQDDYAQEKCANAKASCHEAKQNCCNCSKGPP